MKWFAVGFVVGSVLTLLLNNNWHAHGTTT